MTGSLRGLRTKYVLRSISYRPRVILKKKLRVLNDCNDICGRCYLILKVELEPPDFLLRRADERITNKIG